ncbi:hypothetical protein JXL19_10760 [bacterium]|nr:hypothetical protein [bacterium]
MANDTIVIEYKFKLNSGVQKRFPIRLKSPGLELDQDLRPLGSLPDWSLLGSNQCPHCPLDPRRYRYCPIAANLINVIDFFKDFISCDKAEISICTESREFRKYASVQDGLSSMIGLHMVTSGCPVMDKLRPMAYTHLPFASVEETIYRSMSMYLLAQYFLKKQGGTPDWEMNGLLQIYDDINKVNQSFRKRLLSINPKDASLNALYHLDCFTHITTMSIEDDLLQEIECLFHAYFEGISEYVI